MNALILAAGLGSRLQHLTENTPKALVEYNGKPMIQHVIEKLKTFGIKEIVINVHHFADQIIKFIEWNHSFGLSIRFSDERKRLLDTGGALLNAQDLLSNRSETLIYNTDIESDIDISDFYSYHKQNKALATLAVSRRETNRNLLFEESKMQLKAWINKQTNETKGDYSPNLSAFAFNGIHIVSNDIFKNIQETGKFSIIDLYLRLAQNHKIIGYYKQNNYFRDLGKIEIFQ